MKQIKKEKVGWLEKFLAAIGKHFMFWKQEKISKLLTNLSYRELIRLLVETEGNLESALKVMFELASRSGHDFLTEWVEEGSAIFSKHVGDHALWIKSGYYSFTGDNIKDIRYVPPENENEPHRVIWSVEKCFICEGMKEDDTFKIKKEDLGDMTWCLVIAGIFQTTTNIINEYAGIEYVGKVKETKCTLKGDEHCEFVAEFYPK
ncbi:MAG: hypothetical protein ACTSPY_01925 [Candidatus Helarchaeota archaeon]